MSTSTTTRQPPMDPTRKAALHDLCRVIALPAVDTLRQNGGDSAALSTTAETIVAAPLLAEVLTR